MCGLGGAESIRFHDVRAEASQNPALRRFAAFIGRHAREAMQLARLTQLRYENRLAEIAAEHAAIIAAVAAGDDTAARAAEPAHTGHGLRPRGLPPRLTCIPSPYRQPPPLYPDPHPKHHHPLS